jgi:hypothetical protein
MERQRKPFRWAIIGFVVTIIVVSAVTQFSEPAAPRLPGLFARLALSGHGCALQGGRAETKERWWLTDCEGRSRL